VENAGRDLQARASEVAEDVRLLADLVAEVFEMKLERPWSADPGWSKEFDAQIGDLVSAGNWFAEERERRPSAALVRKEPALVDTEGDSVQSGPGFDEIEFGL
jgi:hypothetical protein